jgi:hypothetical protein
MLTLQTVLKHNPACPVREIGEGLVIMAAQGEATHSLEELGAFIWRQIDGTRDLAAVLAAIVEHYEVDPAIAEQDLLQFAGQMQTAELLLAT